MSARGRVQPSLVTSQAGRSPHHPGLPGLKRCHLPAESPAENGAASALLSSRLLGRVIVMSCSCKQ